MERTNPVFYAHDARFEAHRAQGPHPERPERLRAIHAGLLAPLTRAGAAALAPREAQTEELLRAHSPEHLTQLERALRRGSGYLDGDTFFSEGTREAAWLAAGAAADLGRTLAQHARASGVLLARPPGHHATRTRAMGFCLLNNVAIAAAAALAQGLARVVIVDWDVHHGNGTQAIFEEDPRVLMISLHQWPLYPGTGRSEEIGSGAGRGFTANVPLPAGSGSREYAAAMSQLVAPLIAQFAPELVLISAGYDAHEDDPLGGMQLRDADYGALTSELLAIGRGAGCERVGLVLEGGYDLGALERAGEATAKALLGTRYAFEEGAPARSAQQAIDATRRALGTRWML
jgi:acetoin utilization deacetylase AcuC-like enzyme